MTNTIQPISCVTNIVDGVFKQVDHESNKTITRALGDIERCVIGYSSREGFFGKISGLFYRIWNAVKAVFGQSDWQKARKAFDTLKVTAVNHPIIEQLGAKIIGLYSQINSQESSESELEDTPSMEQMLLQLQMVKSLISNYKFTKEELDNGLKDSIKFNENKGIKNLVNNGAVKKIIGDGKQVVDAVVKLVDILVSRKEEFIALVQETKGKETSDQETSDQEATIKIGAFFQEVLKDAADIEAIKHLVEPLVKSLPQIMKAISEDNRQAALMILMSNPELKEIALAVMSNIPEIMKLGESSGSIGRGLHLGQQKGATFTTSVFG